jgi:hypothetical protein
MDYALFYYWTKLQTTELYLNSLGIYPRSTRI